MASDSRMEMSTVLILWHCIFCTSCGTVFVTTTCTDGQQKVSVQISTLAYFRHALHPHASTSHPVILRSIDYPLISKQISVDQRGEMRKHAGNMTKDGLPHRYGTLPAAAGRPRTEFHGSPERRFCRHLVRLELQLPPRRTPRHRSYRPPEIAGDHT